MAGLFGLLFVAFVGGAKVVKCIQDGINDNNSRSEAISKGRDTYLDSNLCMRDIATNKKIMNYSIPNQYGGRDYVLKVVGSDEILINKTDIKRKEEEQRCKEFAMKIGGSTYKIGGVGDFSHKTGGRYRDIKTGALYTIADIKHGAERYSFYMDVNTWKFVRPTDEWVLDTLLKKRHMEERGFHYKITHPDIVLDEWNSSKNDQYRPVYIQKNSIEYLPEKILEKLEQLNRTKIYNDGENYESIKHLFIWDDILIQEKEERKQKRLREFKEKGYVVLKIYDGEGQRTIVARRPNGTIGHFLY